MIEVFFRWHARINQGEVSYCSSARCKPQQVHPMSEEDEYLCGEVGQSNIVLLAKKAESSDTRATSSTDCARTCYIVKYHASSCCGLSRSSRSARSLTSIRDRLNEGSAGMVSHRVVKQQVFIFLWAK